MHLFTVLVDGSLQVLGRVLPVEVHVVLPRDERVKLAQLVALEHLAVFPRLDQLREGTQNEVQHRPRTLCIRAMFSDRNAKAHTYCRMLAKLSTMTAWTSRRGNGCSCTASKSSTYSRPSFSCALPSFKRECVCVRVCQHKKPKGQRGHAAVPCGPYDAAQRGPSRVPVGDDSMPSRWHP